MKPLMLFAMLALAAACDPPAPPPSEPDPTSGLHAAPVAEKAKPVDCIAIITSRTAHAVSAESDGAVMKLLANADQYVHAGDPIAQLDVSELKASLDKANGQRARAAGEAGRAYAVAAQARRKAHLESRLVRTGASSPEALHSAQSEVSAAGADGAAAAGTIHEADATIAETKRLIEAATIKAPIDGILADIKVKQGEVARKGATIARVLDPTDMIVKFSLPKINKGLVTRGQRVELTYGRDKKVLVTVTDLIDAHDVAIDFLEVVAELDKTTRPDDIHVGVSGQVRLVDKGAVR